MSAPTITRISPTSGPNSGGTTVLITGTNLATPTAVTFGGTPATVNSSTATSISVASPAHAAGAARIVVTTGAGTSTQPVNFTYITVAAPVITSLSPTSGPVSGGNTVTINGTNLQYTTGVTFGTSAASSFAILSSTQVAAVAPAGTAGTSTVSVTNAAGTSGTIPYTYNGVAAPVANSVSPNTGPTAGGNTVVISGTGFTYASAVRFGLTPATSFTVVSSTVINAVVPPGGGATNVFVTGPGGTSTGGPTYTYATDPAPTITALTPAASGPVSGGNTVTIAGSNLNGATAVTFAGIAASSFTILSPTQITAVTPAGTAGTASVLVTTPAGTSTGFNYTYIAAPAPTAVVSSEGVASGGNIVTIIGTNLDGTTGVKFGTTPASFTVASDTEVDVVTPAHVAGMVPVSITTPGGTNNSLSFSFVPSPVIGSITPASGPIGGDTIVTITGAGLINTLDVYFGTTAATAFTVISDNTVTATSPAGAAGATALTVDTASATSNGAIFQYVDAPTLTSLSPTGGAIAGGNNVTLTGTGFLAATDVFFGANPTVFTILSDSSISAVAPSGVGAVAVTAVSPGGTSGAQTYTYS